MNQIDTCMLVILKPEDEDKNKGKRMYPIHGDMRLIQPIGVITD